MNEGQPPDLATPPLRELGADLLRVTRLQKWASLAAPFVFSGAYFGFAFQGWWTFAVLSLAALNFVTYGSTSHDLVHRTLGFSRRTNDWLLCVIELLALRSGHAYQAAHLYHHARYPHHDDVEGAAAHMSWWRALGEGIVFPFRIWWWAMRNHRKDQAWLIGEAVAGLVLMAASLALTPVTLIPAADVAMMLMGAWLNPFLTAFVPHLPHGKNEWFQTRVFRGRVASLVAWEHLYHLEHHLYPAVPHHNWPKLAGRLDRHLEQVGVQPVKLWF